MLLNFFESVQLPGAFALCRLQVSFFDFKGLAFAVADFSHLLVFLNLEEIQVLVVVVADAVNAIHILVVIVAASENLLFFADDKVIFLRAPALTPTATLAVIAFF